MLPTLATHASAITHVLTNMLTNTAASPVVAAAACCACRVLESIVGRPVVFGMRVDRVKDIMNAVVAPLQACVTEAMMAGRFGGRGDGVGVLGGIQVRLCCCDGKPSVCMCVGMTAPIKTQIYHHHYHYHHDHHPTTPNWSKSPCSTSPPHPNHTHLLHTPPTQSLGCVYTAATRVLHSCVRHRPTKLRKCPSLLLNSLRTLLLVLVQWCADDHTRVWWNHRRHGGVVGERGGGLDAQGKGGGGDVAAVYCAMQVAQVYEELSSMVCIDWALRVVVVVVTVMIFTIVNGIIIIVIIDVGCFHSQSSLLLSSSLSLYHTHYHHIRQDALDSGRYCALALMDYVRYACAVPPAYAVQGTLYMDTARVG